MSNVFEEFVVTPPLLTQWMSSSDRSKNIVLLEIEPDVKENGDIRLDLNVAFSAIAVRQFGRSKSNYYIGCTGGEITVEVENAKIASFTADHVIKTEHVVSSKRHRVSDVKISPGFKEKVGPSSSEIALGDIELKGDEERKFETRFSCAERDLATVYLGNSVQWTLHIPRTEHLIRDYLLGNLLLFAECPWERARLFGKVDARPSDVRFFDSERRILSNKKAIMMRFVLWKRKIDVPDGNGISVSFSASKKNA